MRLFWWKHKEGNGNFGDELNPYLIEKLSGITPKHIEIKHLYNNPIKTLKSITRAVWGAQISVGEAMILLKYGFMKNPQIILGIGSVLHLKRKTGYDVWGSGIISKFTRFEDGNFLAVRGKYTQQKCAELGYNVPEVLGDPALLLPLVFQPNSKKSYKIGIIPHMQHFSELSQLNSKDLLVINLLDDIEKIVDEICSCELTLSTSLHGIIVSHAYEIPSLWVNFKENKQALYGDNIKFKDYFSSVDMAEYDFALISAHDLNNLSEFVTKINTTYRENLLIEGDVLSIIQQQLLSVAPFPVKKDILAPYNE